MNTSKIIELTTEAINHMSDGNADSALLTLYSLRETAAAEIRREEAKRSGTTSRLKAAERIIKSAKSEQPSRPCMHGAWIDNSKQYTSDGFRIVRFNEPLPLESIPEGAEPLNMSRVIAPGMNTGAKLDLPELGALRAYIKTEKARIKAEKLRGVPLWDFGDGLPAVDAQYLADMLEALPGCTATAAKDHPELRIIYFESENGDGGLCPVEKVKKHG